MFRNAQFYPLLAGLLPWKVVKGGAPAFYPVFHWRRAIGS